MCASEKAVFSSNWASTGEGAVVVGGRHHGQYCAAKAGIVVRSPQYASGKVGGWRWLLKKRCVRTRAHQAALSNTVTHDILPDRTRLHAPALTCTHLHTLAPACTT